MPKIKILLLGLLSCLAAKAQQEDELYAQYFYTGDSILFSMRINFQAKGNIKFQLHGNEESEDVVLYTRSIKLSELGDGAFAQKLRIDTSLNLSRTLDGVSMLLENGPEDRRDLGISFGPISAFYLDENNRTNFSRIFVVTPQSKPKLLLSKRVDSAVDLEIKNKQYKFKIDIPKDNWPLSIALDTFYQGLYSIVDARTGTQIGAPFQIINPNKIYSKLPAAPELNYDLDTCKNDFAELSRVKLEKALRMTSFRMNKRDADRLLILLNSKQEHLVADQLMRFWAYQNPDQFWKTTWSAYVDTVNSLFKKYRSRNGGGIEAPELQLTLRYGRADEVYESSNHPDTWPYKLWVYLPKGPFDKIKYFLMTRGNMESNYRMILNSELSDRESWKSQLFRIPDNLLNQSTEVYQKVMELTQE